MIIFLWLLGTVYLGLSLIMDEPAGPSAERSRELLLRPSIVAWLTIVIMAPLGLFIFLCDLVTTVREFLE